MPVGVSIRRVVESRVVPITAVILIGAALLLPRLGTQSLWLDESLTVGPAVTATSVGDLLAQVRAVDTQPPASHLLLWAYAAYAPRTEFFYRLPSFLAVELGIVMLYALTRRLWGPAVALAVALCAQLSPYLCFYAAEARNYGMWFLCVTTSAFVALRWYETAIAPASRRLWSWTAALAVINALGLWTHLFHAFVVFAETAILVPAIVFRTDARTSRWRALGALAAADLVTAALFAPWVVVLARAARAGTAGVSWTRTFSAGSLAYYVFAVHFGGSLGPSLRALHAQPLSELAAAHAATLVLAAAAIGVTALTYLALVRDALRIRARRAELVLLVAWPVLTLVCPIAYAALRDFPLHPRHLMFVWPVLPIVLALGFVRFPRLRVLVAAAVVLQVVALGNLLFDGRYAKDDERGAVRFATQRSSGRVAYVLGDVAPLYAAEGRVKGFGDFRPDTDDVWFVDNRAWEPENRRARARLASRMRALGMRYEGGTTRFRGIVLRHWTRVG